MAPRIPEHSRKAAARAAGKVTSAAQRAAEKVADPPAAEAKKGWGAAKPAGGAWNLPGAKAAAAAAQGAVEKAAASARSAVGEQVKGAGAVVQGARSAVQGAAASARPAIVDQVKGAAATVQEARPTVDPAAASVAQGTRPAVERAAASVVQRTLSAVDRSSASVVQLAGADVPGAAGAVQNAGLVHASPIAAPPPAATAPQLARTVASGVDRAWDALVDRAFQGGVALAGGVNQALGVKEHLARLQPGDGYTLAVGGDVVIGPGKGGAKGGLDVERRLDGSYDVTASGRMTGGVAAALPKGLVVSGDVDAVVGPESSVSFNFKTLGEAQRAAVLMARASRETAKLDGPGISAADAAWLATKVSSVELNREASAQISASLGSDGPARLGAAYAGLFTKDKITSQSGVRLEFENGRPVALVTRDELKGELRGGLGLGFTAPRGSKGNTSSVLGGYARGTVTRETRYQLPAVSARTLDQAHRNPRAVLGGLARLATPDGESLSVSALAQGDGARNGPGRDVKLELSGPPGVALSPGFVAGLARGNAVDALRGLPAGTEVSYRNVPFERHGVYANPSISLPGFKVTGEVESLRTDRHVNLGVWTSRAASEVADLLEGQAAQVVTPGRITSTTPPPTGAQLIADIENNFTLPDGATTTPGGFQKLTDEQRAAIHRLSDDERRLFQATLGELAALKAGKVSPAQYMVDVTNKAAELSGGDRDRFARLLMMPFSAGTSENDGLRAVAGSSPHVAGNVLERIYNGLANGNNGVQGGFNPNIVDDRSLEGTVTHHFRELFATGYNRGKFIGDRATEHVDRPEDNPGDVRNGYFAVMIGDGLRTGKLTPDEAAGLIEAAFKNGDGAGARWGNTERAGAFLDPARDYAIDDWLATYRG